MDLTPILWNKLKYIGPRSDAEEQGPHCLLTNWNKILNKIENSTHNPEIRNGLDYYNCKGRKLSFGLNGLNRELRSFLKMKIMI